LIFFLLRPEEYPEKKAEEAAAETEEAEALVEE